MNNLALTKRSCISVINSLNLNLFTMKKLLALIAIISAFPFFANAQWATTGSDIYNTNTGNVGVGTTTPQGRLDIYNPTNAAIMPLLSIRSNFNAIGNYGMIRFGDYTQTTNYQKGALIYESVSNAARGRFHIALENTDGTGSVSLSDAKMTVLSNGNVGVGSITPTGHFTIGGHGNLNPNPSLTTETDYVGLNLTFKGESLGGNYDLGVIKMVQPGNAFIDHADMVFQTSLGTTTEKMRISGEGNVSIGTSDAKGYKLAVNGTAIATEMFVKLHGDWPDYVFKPAYKLPKLSEVKTYIDANQHLPDMPSEADVEAKGINLGEINKLLVKKVEELTLYMIELKAENELIKERLNKISKANGISLKN